MAEELEDAKKAMGIMKGIVQEKDDMIIALREIMGMMEGRKKRTRRSNEEQQREEEYDERDLTDSLIQEIRKKNRNLQLLRMTLANETKTSAAATATTSPSGGRVSPGIESINEKRRKKRELEAIRAQRKRDSHLG